MQERHRDRARYFRELAATCEQHFVPYFEQYLLCGSNRPAVLEIGCGDGGNLLPLARRGWEAVGVDISEARIRDARAFFEAEGAEATFIAADILTLDDFRGHFDLIICHDVIEHIADKRRFLSRIEYFMKPGGVLFMAFPAWQMPFGGHQQICHGRLLSRLPFYHLLPRGLYRRILEAGGEGRDCVDELLAIKSTRLTIERFERLAADSGLRIADRRLWLVNPHYQTKFGLHPRRLWPAMAAIPYVRNFFSTGCFYILTKLHTAL